jgi:hypothetical protein
MKVSNTGKNNSEVDFSYHIDGQLASRRSGDKVENFYWDDLALVKKDGTDYINEPYATGGNPVLANDEVMFNDMLGTTLGSVDNGKFSSTPTTAFGAGNDNAFFTGKPHVEGLGYAFMFRNYRPEMGKWQTADPFGLMGGTILHTVITEQQPMLIFWADGETRYIAMQPIDVQFLVALPQPRLRE